ncbi:MAG: EamA family transporter [Weeksellaceae bacterium]|nr:EamA family transporter [Weeksellaceae bacterium]MDX9704132.1 EamA family transporter [Weeksellaceae bacterium]
MYTKYYLSVISAFTIWGFFSLPLKALDTYSSLDILLFRLTIASVVILLISFTYRKKISFENIRQFQNFSKKEKRKLLLLNVVSAVLLAINWYLFIYVMNNISVKATSLAYLICPILTTILAFIFLKDKLTKIQWIAVFLSIFSCILLSLGNFLDIFYSSIIAISYAIYLILQKNNYHLDRFFTLTFQIACGTLILLPLFAYSQETPVKGLYFYGISTLIAVFFTITPMFLNVYSLNKLSSSTAGIFICLNPLISFFLAVFYFKESMDGIQIFSYSLVFFALLMFNHEISRFFLRKRIRN